MYAVNGQTARGKLGFSGILYRATASLAGFEAGTFLTEAAARIGGFTLPIVAAPDFVARWTGGGHSVEHPNFHASRFVLIQRTPHDTAAVLRWMATDGREKHEAHASRVRDLGARMAWKKAADDQLGRGTMARHWLAVLMAEAADDDLARATVAAPDGAPAKLAYASAARFAKSLNLLTL